MIGLTSRPPQLETPFAVFNEGAITPNDAFFVRYHLANIPFSDIDPDTWTVEVKGKVGKPLKLKLAGRLKKQHAVSRTGCCDAEPVLGQQSQLLHAARARRPIGQRRNGQSALARRIAQGRARPGGRGARGEAGRLWAGFDGPVIDKTPVFVKALDIDHARDGEVMIAWLMNGADLPVLNGYPVRMIVPGWYGTCWIDHLNEGSPCSTASSTASG